MRLIGYLLLCLFLVTGCRQRSTHSERLVLKEFPKNVRVNFQENKVEPVLYYVGDMTIIHNTLVTVDMKNDVFFQLFRLPAFTYLGQEVKRGEGPSDEIAILPNLNRIGRDSFAYRSLHQIKMIDLNENEPFMHVEKAIDLPMQYMDILNCAIDKDGTFGYDMLSESTSEYRKFDFGGNGDLQDFGPSFPEVGMRVDGSRQNSIFTKIMAISPSKNRFVALYDKFPLMRICDRKSGKIIREIEYDNGQKLPLAYLDAEINPTKLDEYTINYLKVKVTDHYIYGLYSGKTNSELSTNANFSGDCGAEIHVWDWDGNAVARLILPKYVSSFAVSPDDSLAVFYSFLHDDILYKIDLDL